MPSVPARRADRGFAARSASKLASPSRTFPNGICRNAISIRNPISAEMTRSRMTTPTPANFRCAGDHVSRLSERSSNPMKRSNQGHRMRQPPPQPIGIADQGVERQGCDDNKERVAPDQHVSAPRARVPRRGDRALPTASGRRIRSAFPGSQGALRPDKSAPAPDAA